MYGVFEHFGGGENMFKSLINYLNSYTNYSSLFNVVKHYGNISSCA